MDADIEPVICELQYSGALSAILAAASLATIAIVAVLPWSAPLRAFVALAVAACACRARRAAFATRRLRLGGDGSVELVLRDGRILAGSVRSGSFVAPWLTIVRWRAPGAWLDGTVLVVPGMLQPESFRRLRIVLRWA